MKPVKFKYSNAVYGEGQDEYLPLPALKLDGTNGEVITKWKPSFKDRIKILFGAHVYTSQLTFQRLLQPIRLGTKRQDFFITNEDIIPKLKIVLNNLGAHIKLFFNKLKNEGTDSPETNEE